MIPKTRAVIGQDLDDIRKSLGLSTADACYLFGISIVKWTDVVRKGKDSVVSDPTLALLARVIAANPELAAIPTYPDVDEMMELFSTIGEVDQKMCSVMMGNESTSAYRWRRLGTRQTPPTQRLMYYLKQMLKNASINDRPALLTKWTDTVRAEGSHRIDGDVFKIGRWSNAPQKAGKAASDE